MRYDAFSNLPMIRAAYLVADYFDTAYPVARSIVQACREAYALGNAGKDYPKPIATRDAKDLVHDAWHDGITRTGRIVVRLESSDLQCQQCGCNYLDCDDSFCPNCDTGDFIGRNVTACAEGDFVHEWAYWDGSIGGSSWKTPSDMPGTAYAMPCDHPGLVAELQAEGYTLDLSEYDAS